MPANKWDTELLASKCILLEYNVDPNDIQKQVLVRGYRGLDLASATALKTALDAETTLTDPVIDGVTFTGDWTVSQARIIRIESGVLAGSHEVRQSVKYGTNEACMSVVNERLVRSRAFPIEQNENAWMYYELMRKEETKKWVNLTYAAAVREYEYLWKIYSDDDLGTSNVKEDCLTWVGEICTKWSYYRSLNLREHMIIRLTEDTSVICSLYYGDFYTDSATLSFVADTYYIVEVELVEGKYKPTITAITNPVIETWYEEERDSTYTMYRTLKETTSTPIMRNRTLQYAGMARVYGGPVVGDGYITIYGLNDDDAVIYEHTKFRIGSDTYRVTADCEGEEYDPEGDPPDTTWVWKPSITPEVTTATDELVDAGDTNETQVYFVAL